MTTKRKSIKSSKPSPVSIRINGRAVTHAAGAKLAAEWLGCVQTTGPQVGQGSVLQMVEAIGAGDVVVMTVLTDNPIRMREVIDKIAAIVHDDPRVATVLAATAAALRNAARLREASET